MNFVYDTGEKHIGPGYKIHMPIVGTIAGTTLSTGSWTPSGTANVEVEQVLTPTVTYTEVDLQEDVLLTAVKDPVQIYAPVLAEGIYQKLEADITALYATTTTTVGASSGSFLEADYLTGISKLMAAGGDKVVLGNGGNVAAVYHPNQWDNVIGVGSIASAAVRGSGDGPAKTGVIGMAYGVNLLFTANVSTLTSAYHNLIFAKKWVWVARKNRPKIEMERTGLVTKAIASHMYAVGVLHTACGVRHLTVNS